MKIYYAGNDRANHSSVHCPAKDPRVVKVRGVDTDIFRDDLGEAIVYPVQFKGGMAEVEDHVGEYLVSIGHAKKTRLMIPA